MNMTCFFSRPEPLLLFSGCEDGDRKETFLKHLGSIGSQKCDPFQPASKKESSFSQASIFQISRQVGCLLFIKKDAHTIFRNLPPILTFGCLTERVAGDFQPNAKTIQVWCFSRTSATFFSSWWFFTNPIWKIWVKLDHFPNFRGENKKCLKPSPSFDNSKQVSVDNSNDSPI